ncbi:hypothetical protein NSK_006782 [Nannochloropsis salina CCMP1776]|uniref:Uncharacterized protein n=1 Tax=Nannochloropsis salina CCMP1776 TaxID=1027361 RepID=A0A4D9CYQ2_9STRA|nr:hypothetical protein NSK_006782 [Nannochloropsis salina CCMP1776]|eukprot:TFJ81528.1 hypothetical protein NSK_006782 [Nannochloropsis salina CCMP1776]
MVYKQKLSRLEAGGHGLHAADGREEMREHGVHINSTLYSDTSPQQIIETLRAVTCSCLSHPALHIAGMASFALRFLCFAYLLASVPVTCLS